MSGIIQDAKRRIRQVRQKEVEIFVLRDGKPCLLYTSRCV